VVKPPVITTGKPEIIISGFLFLKDRFSSIRSPRRIQAAYTLTAFLKLPSCFARDVLAGAARTDLFNLILIR
jgi:hypothetical protein